MSKTDLEKKARAALLLAGSSTYRQIAEDVGVSVDTLRTWRRRPEFAAAVDEVREIVRAGGRTGAELYEAVSAVLDRFEGGGRETGTVTVVIPAYATPKQRRKAMARGIARALDTRIQW